MHSQIFNSLLRPCYTVDVHASTFFKNYTHILSHVFSWIVLALQQTLS